MRSNAELDINVFRSAHMRSNAELDINVFLLNRILKETDQSDPGIISARYHTIRRSRNN